MNHFRTATVAAVCSVLWALPAAAQEKTFTLDRAQVAAAPDDGYMLFRPTLHDKTRFYGSLTLGYTLNPLRDRTLTGDEDVLRETGHPVSSQLITYLGAGVEVASRVGFTVALPIGVYMAGEDPAEVAGTDAPNAAVRPAALHDLRLDARVPLYESRSEAFRFGIGGAMWLPTGDSDSFAGDGETTAMPYASAEHDFGAFLLGGQLGVHLRPSNGITNSELDVGSDLRWVVGGYVPLRDDRLRVGAELWGTTGITRANGRDTVLEPRNTDLEWLAQVRHTFGEKRRAWVMGGGGTRLASGYGAPDLRLLATIGYWFPLRDGVRQVEPGARAEPVVVEPDSDRDGDGYPDTIDACPDLPEDGAEPEPSDGCPAGADRDGDGIPDDADRCPDDPEDLDGVADEDGCPEHDADNDRIPDATDRCPEAAGFDHPDPEKFGCPLGGFIEGKEELVPLEPIQFEYNRAVIKPVSYPILDDVVAFMRSRADQRIAVHGHTDDRGSDEYNLRLSRARARSVMQYLIGKGIAAQRLESEGFGEARPKTTNDTDEGRAINRRVEFKLID